MFLYRTWRKESIMQKDIHPKMYETKVECACGAKFTVRSTKEEIQANIKNSFETCKSAACSYNKFIFELI